MKLVTLTVLAAVLPVLVWTACGGTQTHDEIDVSSYAEHKALCVQQAQDRDAGQACLDYYTQRYAELWPDAAAITPAQTALTVDGGSK